MDLWTIETHGRANEERRKSSHANHAVKEILDQQCKQMAMERKLQKKHDIEAGKQLVADDLKK